MMMNMKPAYMPDDDWMIMFQRKLSNWAQGCLNGTPLGASGEAGLGVQKMLDDIYRSAEAGKEVTIK